MSFPLLSRMAVAALLLVAVACTNQATQSQAPATPTPAAATGLIGRWRMDSIIFRYGPGADSTLVMVPTSSELRLDSNGTGTGSLKALLQGKMIESLTTITTWQVVGDSIKVRWRYETGQMEDNTYARTTLAPNRERWVDPTPGLGGKTEVLVLSRK